MKIFIIPLVLFLTLTVALAYHNSQNTTGTLKVSATEIKNSDGEIRFYLFNEKVGFPDDSIKAIRHLSAKIVDGGCTVIFENLPYGQYALFCFHDENNDKVLNKTWYGKPKEGVAYSNNVHGSIAGSPAFDDAKFNLNKQLDSLSIKINYF